MVDQHDTIRICEKKITNLKQDEKVSRILPHYHSQIDTESPVKDAVFNIDLTDQIVPKSKTYSVPAPKEKMLETQIIELQNKSTISRSTSMYGAPCFIIEKPDGSGRLLINFVN